MPYILYKTNGTVLTTVEDAGLDTTTDLQFVGRNYSGYGQVQNENFLKLLENFSSASAPAKPLKGQIWFDSTANTLRFSYNGQDFKGLANLFVQNSAPLVSSLIVGDLWWDTSTAQLKLYDGSSFPVIGPISPATLKAFWSPDTVATDFYSDLPILKATLDNKIVSVISYRNFTVTNALSLYNEGFTSVKAGMTLPGADDITGVSSTNTNAGYMLWGTAAHSLYSYNADFANTSTTASYATTATEIVITDVGSTTTNYFLTFVSTATDSQSLSISGNVFYNPSTDVLNATATAAFYADLAERYEADAVYDQGTVLIIGGEKEVTLSEEYGSTAVAGIVSTKPAYMMNSEAGTDETHPYIALKGRVPCKIIGPVKKGDLLVTSKEPGYAQVYDWSSHHPSAIIGKALENFEGSRGIIEVKV
jgi:hypothetical protein